MDQTSNIRINSLFYGSYEFLMDEKGRVTIPSQFKRLMVESDHDTFVMTRGISNCIFAYPFSAWEHYMIAMRRMKVPTHERLKTMRIILAWASNCTFDSQGRLKIPTRLAGFAKLDRNVMIVGHQDRLEIWNKDVYEKYHGVELEEGYDYETHAERLFVDMMPGVETDDKRDAHPVEDATDLPLINGR